MILQSSQASIKKLMVSSLFCFFYVFFYLILDFFITINIDARLDQLIMDAADGNIETAPRGGKGKTAALSTRNRKRKIDSEEDEKLTAVVGSTGDCNVQILEEFIDDENNKK